MKFEFEIIKTLQLISSPIFDGVLKLVSHISNYIGFIFICGLFLILYNKKYAVYFALTYSLSILINYIFKYFINRPRPYSVCGEIINIMPAAGSSMPSGHTLSATLISCFCLYIVFNASKNFIVRFLSILCFSIFIIMVIISRMYLGQHYLTDTLVGLFEGIIISLLSLKLYNKIKK